MAADAVVDASALAALLFGEPGAKKIARRLEDRRLLAPTLLRYELASVCRKKSRKRPESRASLHTALALFSHMGVDEVQVPATDLAEIADQTGLTAYDAAYLWLARTADAELVTLDTGLAAAWRSR